MNGPRRNDATDLGDTVAGDGDDGCAGILQGLERTSGSQCEGGRRVIGSGESDDACGQRRGRGGDHPVGGVVGGEIRAIVGHPRRDAGRSGGLPGNGDDVLDVGS